MKDFSCQLNTAVICFGSFISKFTFLLFFYILFFYIFILHFFMGSVGPRGSTGEGETDGLGVDDLGMNEYYSKEKLSHIIRQKRDNDISVHCILLFLISFPFHSLSCVLLACTFFPYNFVPCILRPFFYTALALMYV